MRLSRYALLSLVIVGCATRTPQPLAQPDAGNASEAHDADVGSPAADAGDADVGSPSDDTDDRQVPEAAFRPLWNGVDFTGWDRYLGIPVGESTPLGVDNDPRSVFSV